MCAQQSGVGFCCLPNGDPSMSGVQTFYHVTHRRSAWGRNVLHKIHASRGRIFLSQQFHPFLFGFVYSSTLCLAMNSRTPTGRIICFTSSKMDFQAASINEIFCSRCRRCRPADEFKFNKQGKQNKTCRRHSQKRALEFDDWEDFIKRLRNWNRPASTSETLDLSEPKFTDKSCVCYSNLLVFDRNNARYCTGITCLIWMLCLSISVLCTL